MIKLIVGLGNPGKEYLAHRHNAGFWFVDRLAKKLGCCLDSLKHLKTWHCEGVTSKIYISIMTVFRQNSAIIVIICHLIFFLVLNND